jgi:hypothetical protein
MTIMEIDRNTDISGLNELIKGIDFEMKPASWYRENFSKEQILKFLHEQAIYVLPTDDLMEYLFNLIGDDKCIEVGAGRGFVCNELGIIGTDSKLQEDPKVKLYYQALGQPVIKYPKHVRKMDAIKAAKTLKPDTVIGCYVTHKYRKDTQDGNYWGVDYERLLSLVKKRLILVGNKETHKNNPLMELEHEEIEFPGLITRSYDDRTNRIFIWTK